VPVNQFTRQLLRSIRWYFRFGHISCRIARYKLFLVTFICVLASCGLAGNVGTGEKRKPKSVMSSASMVFGQ